MKRILISWVLMLFGVLNAIEAMTYTVMNTNDTGAGSLPEAIDDANANPGHDTINFGLGAGDHTITLTTGTLEITDQVTVQLPAGALGTVTVSGNDASRVFHISDSQGGTVTLRGFSIRDGLAPSGVYYGGGIYMNGVSTSVVLEDMTIIDNEATYGGGLRFESENGVLVIDHCQIIDNTATDGGGGIYIQDELSVTITHSTITSNTANSGGGLKLGREGSLDIQSCTISNNHASGFGGGFSIGNYSAPDGPVVTMTNTTISGNTANGTSGAGKVSYGVGTLTNCTIFGNVADADGDGTSPDSYGGISLNTDASWEFRNCIIAGNIDYDRPSDISGSDPRAISLGSNVIGNGDNSVFINGVNGDIVGTELLPMDPMLSSLQDNGGLTESHLLISGSPAIDAGDSAAVTDPPFDGPTFVDQDGNTRIIGNAVDIGATEFQEILVVENTADSGAGSLRDAVAQANLTGGKTVVFSESEFESTPQTIALTSGELPITNEVFIDGPDIGVILSADGNSRVINVTASGTGVVDLQNLRMIDGSTPNNGGVLRVAGVGTEVLVRKCGMSNSTANGSGGGVYVNQGTATLLNCTVSDNHADDDGGGLQCSGSATLNVLQSTISGNTTNERGGGLFANNSTATILNGTITNNTCDATAGNTFSGGGIRRANGTATVTVGNTIIAGNVDGSSTGDIHPDISGQFVSLGHNLIGNDEGLSSGGTPFTHGVNGDQVGTSTTPIDPLLDSLSLPTGALTRVHLLQSGSSARDAGDDGLLTNAAWPNTPIRDQRTQFRVINGSVDIGSVEHPNGMIVRIEPLDATMNDFVGDTAAVKISRSYADGDLDVEVEVPAASPAQSSDFVPGFSSTTYTIPDGKRSLTVIYTPVKDGLVEGDETLRLKLVDTSDYNIDSTFGDKADLTITDGDFTVSNGLDSGMGSLRDAVDAANMAGGGLITIPQDTGPIELTSGQLTITEQVTIKGNGETIDAGGTSRIMKVNGIGCVRLQDLVLTGGASDFEGGAVKAESGACLVITRCALTNNTATETGGGLYFEGADVTIRNSSIDSNTVTNTNGGGIHGVNGTLEMVSSTIAKNTAPNHGGGIALDGTDATLTNVTITANTCDSDDSGSGNGGGLWAKISGSETKIINTLIAENFDTPNNSGSDEIRTDLAGKVFSLGHNLIGVNTLEETDFPVGVPNANNDYVGTAASPVDAGLMESGATPLYYLVDFASQAIDNGDTSAVTSPPFGSPATDQRDHARVFDVGAVDIGAIEMDYLPVLNLLDGGFGSLRGRIGTANTHGHGSIIFTNAGPITINLTSGQLEITAPSVSICGPDDTKHVTIDANSNSRVFQILPTVGLGDILLKNLTITGGHASGAQAFGGGIYVDQQPKLRIESCTITGNTADSFGGGIANGGLAMGASIMTMLDTTISSNVATLGGGLLNLDNSATIKRCTFTDNEANDNGGSTDGRGGAIYSTHELCMVNCTLSENRADNEGGGLYSDSLVESSLLHCTIVENQSNDDGSPVSFGGGGVFVELGTLKVENTVIAKNDDTSPTYSDVSGTFLSSGYNLIGNASGATGFGSSSDQTGHLASHLDPLLGPLADHGGATLTHLPVAYSPLVEGASNAGIATDQRGMARNVPLLGHPDIGAAELDLLTYDEWVEVAFPSFYPESKKVATADPDGDGLLNGVEFYTGLNPLSYDDDPFQGLMDDGDMVMRYPARAGIRPFHEAEIEWSKDMDAWNQSSIAITVDEDLGAVGLMMEARLPLDGSEDRRFLRLVALPPAID